MAPYRFLYGYSLTVLSWGQSSAEKSWPYIQWGWPVPPAHHSHGQSSSAYWNHPQELWQIWYWMLGCIQPCGSFADPTLLMTLTDVTPEENNIFLFVFWKANKAETFHLTQSFIMYSHSIIPSIIPFSIFLIYYVIMLSTNTLSWRWGGGVSGVAQGLKKKISGKWRRPAQLYNSTL